MHGQNHIKSDKILDYVVNKIKRVTILWIHRLSWRDRL